MCRFLAYLGAPIVMAELLYRPDNSLIRQSVMAKEREEPLNGDGFGVGWYTPEVEATPCVFTSVAPAWSNENLRRLAPHVASPSFFAHVRAASSGMRVSEENCHPFQHGRYLWMHNGSVGGFREIKRGLRASLPDAVYHGIFGSTDSEHAFAVFLAELGDVEPRRDVSEIARAVSRTVARLERLKADAGAHEPSFCNFAVTDGKGLVALRYVSDPALEPHSLYYAAGLKFECCDGSCRLVEAAVDEHAVVVSSEPLTERRDDWVRVGANHILMVSPPSELGVEEVPLSRLLDSE